MPTSTPWGASQYSKKYARGIIFYGTAGHGGFHVSPTKLAQMPEYFRMSGGWFEEDCEWCMVAICFPEAFPAPIAEEAKTTLKNWYPNLYEKHYNVVLQKGESHTRDRELFLTEHKNDYLVLAASGKNDGTVEVFAGRGGRLPNGCYPPDTKTFIVPKDEYNPQMVLDESKYKVKEG